MANVKISALPVATRPLAGTEVYPIVQSGVTKQTDVPSIPISMKDFDVAADGVANDTANAQAAIDYVESLGGGQIYCPPGRYSLNVTIKDGVQLVGNSWQTMVTPGAQPTQFRPWNGDLPIIDTPAGLISTPAVSGINFIGDISSVSGTSIGVYFRNVNRGMISNCTFDHFADPGIQQDAGAVSTFKDLFLVNCVMNRTRTRVTGAIDLSGTDHWLARIEAGCSILTNITAGQQCVAIYLAMASGFVSDVVGEFGDFGIYNDGAWIRFNNCRADHNMGHGWYINGSQCVYSTCTSLTNGIDSANTWSGFYCSPTSTSNMFVACHDDSVIGSGVTEKYSFLDERSDAGGKTRCNSYVNCFGINYGTAMFSMDPALGSSFESRQASAFNSSNAEVVAGVIDFSANGLVSAGPHSMCVLTNFLGVPHNITNFIGVCSGGTVRLLGNALATIVNGATIKTNTGANKTLQADKIYTFTLYNGVWYENA